MFHIHDLTRKDVKNIKGSLKNEPYYAKVLKGKYKGSIGRVIDIDIYDNLNHTKIQMMSRVKIKVLNHYPFSCRSDECKLFIQKTKEVVQKHKKIELPPPVFERTDIFNRELKVGQIVSFAYNGKICFGTIKKFSKSTPAIYISSFREGTEIARNPHNRRIKNLNTICIFDDKLEDYIMLDKLKY